MHLGPSNVYQKVNLWQRVKNNSLRKLYWENNSKNESFNPFTIIIRLLNRKMSIVIKETDIFSVFQLIFKRILLLVRFFYINY